MSKRWYVVHAYSGMEKSVGRAIQDRVDRAGMQDFFGRILVPTEEVVEMKNGQRAISERRFFPGYVFVEMEMTDESWHLVKNTNKVTGFVGGVGNRPTPIPDRDVDKILAQIREGVEKPRPKVLLRWARWCVCVTVRSPISTAAWRKSTTTRVVCGFQSRSSAGQLRLNSSLPRSKSSETPYDDQRSASAGRTRGRTCKFASTRTGMGIRTRTRGRTRTRTQTGRPILRSMSAVMRASGFGRKRESPGRLCA